MSTDRVKKRSRRPRNEEEQEEERQHGLDDEKPQQTVRPRSQHGKRNNTAPQPQQPTASAASSQQLVAPPQSDVDKKKKRRRKRARRDAASDTDAAAASPAAPSPSSAPLPHVPVGCFKAFVGGLPYDVSEAELTAFFQRDGCFVWSVRIAQYREGHQFESQQRGSETGRHSQRAAFACDRRTLPSQLRLCSAADVALSLCCCDRRPASLTSSSRMNRRWLARCSATGSCGATASIASQCRSPSRSAATAQPMQRQQQ